MRRWAQLIFAVLVLQFIHAKFVTEFQYFGNCKASHNALPYHLENTSYGMVSSEQSEFNTTLVIERDFDLMAVKMKIYECKTMNEAECELFVIMQDTDHCARLQEKGQFYSIFGDSARPPITCPLKKGTHQIVHARVPLETLSKLPVVDNVIYRLDFVYEVNGKLVGCWKVKVKKQRLRKRKN